MYLIKKSSLDSVKKVATIDVRAVCLINKSSRTILAFYTIPGFGAQIYAKQRGIYLYTYFGNPKADIHTLTYNMI